MKLFLLITILALTNGKHDKPVKGYTRYAFYRDLEIDPTNTRRVFGGEVANLQDFPAMAALLDRFWATRCSGSIITPFWTLTAAHCVTARIAYVRYNSDHPTGSNGDSSPVLYLYRHPNFKVVQEDEGRGMDVTLLHHDLGLIRTRDEMKLTAPLLPLSSMRRFNPSDLDHKELTILGFGQTLGPETFRGGDQLYAVKLQMISCDRGSWFHCLCGIASSGREQRGVCSGDSGGPVMYNGVQVGVTSMGPVECVSIRSDPPEGATSVFTSTFHYVDLINATISDADFEIKKHVRVRPGSNREKLHHSSVGMVFKVHIPIILFSVFAMVL